MVGYTENSLFWKDIRRILYSKYRFRAFCRIANDGFQKSWSPIILAQVLESFQPGIGNQINAISEFAFSNTANTPSSDRLTDKKNRMHNALLRYARLLSSHSNVEFPVSETPKLEKIAEEHCKLHGSQNERREAFEAIFKLLQAHTNINVQPEINAELREQALNDSGLNFAGQIVQSDTLNDAQQVTSPEKRVLETEFIAIYW